MLRAVRRASCAESCARDGQLSTGHTPGDLVGSLRRTMCRRGAHSSRREAAMVRPVRPIRLVVAVAAAALLAVLLSTAAVAAPGAAPLAPGSLALALGAPPAVAGVTPPADGSICYFGACYNYVAGRQYAYYATGA